MTPGRRKAPFLVATLRDYERNTARPPHKPVKNNRPQDVIWPHAALPQAVRIMAPGPLTELAWNRYWRRLYAQALTNIEAAQDERLGNILGSMKLGPATALSGARLLAQGVNLQPAELANIQRFCIVEQPEDPLVRPCFQHWQEAASGAYHEIVEHPGHGSFGGCITSYHFIFRLCSKNTFYNDDIPLDYSQNRLPQRRHQQKPTTKTEAIPNVMLH